MTPCSNHTSLKIKQITSCRVDLSVLISPTMTHPTSGHEAISLERRRQIEQEGFQADTDDIYTKGQLLEAADCYACPCEFEGPPPGWPWDDHWWKPSTPQRNLEKAGALVDAEIARLTRLKERYADSWDRLELQKQKPCINPSSI